MKYSLPLPFYENTLHFLEFMTSDKFTKCAEDGVVIYVCQILFVYPKFFETCGYLLITKLPRKPLSVSLSEKSTISAKLVTTVYNRSSYKQ